MNDNNQRVFAGGLVALTVLVVGGFYWQNDRNPSEAGAPEVLDARRPQAPDARPNVIIILWDTARADRMSLYGYDLETTPRMRAWAEKGVVFENAVSPAMWTVPSHASMFTGLPPTTHGAGYDYRWLDHSNVTVAEHFRSNGYDTYAFSANPNLTPTGKNLLQGFDTIHLSWGRRWREKVHENAESKQIPRDQSTEISPAYTQKALTNRPFTYNAAPVTQEAFGGWLLNRPEKDKPFFAYLSYMESHKPRIPSLASRKKVADDDTIETALQTDLSFRNQLAYSYGQHDYTEAELDAINRTYDACLIDLDNATGDLLDQLAQHGMLDNTIIVFTSDHGEMLGEHQLFGHRASVFQQLLHVPLVISWPAGLEARRVTEPVSNLDIYSTLVSLAGLPAPDRAMSSRNLVRDVAGSLGAFAETISIDRLGWQKITKLYPSLERDPWTVKYRSFIDAQWKMIRDSNGEESLFDLHADPGEEHDMAGANPEALTAMREKLDAYIDGMAPYDPSKRTKRDLRDKTKAEDGQTDAQREMLEQMGYLSDDEGEAEPAPKKRPPQREKPPKKRGKRGKAKAP